MEIIIYKTITEEEQIQIEELFQSLGMTDTDYEIENISYRKSESIEWEKHVQSLNNAETTIQALSQSLGMSYGTTRNNLIKNGYVTTPKQPNLSSTDTQAILEALHNGERVDTLAAKYHVTPTHIRLIRRNADI